MSKLICLDAGHGGTDSGAVGNGVVEKDINLKMAFKVGELLEMNGFDVCYTRVSDSYINLGERCRIANSNNAEVFVSIHINSATNTTARGTETLCYTKNKLAEDVQDCLIKKLNTTDRGIKERKDLYVLNGTKMTAILIELAFLSNSEDANLLKDESFLDNSAVAIATGISKYFDVTFKNIIEDTEDNEMVTQMNIQVNGKDIKINRILKDGKNYIEVAGLENVGFDVGYDKNTKLVTVNNQRNMIDFEIDGERQKIEGVNLNGTNFVPVRSLASAVGNFSVGYENGVVKVLTDKY